MSLLRDRRIAALLGAEVVSSLGTQSWALAHFETRGVIATVLGVQTAAVLAIVFGALVERSQLRVAPVDSPA